MAAPVRNLTDRLPDETIDDARAFDIFLEWIIDQEVELYPAQEEAVMELFAGKHVILKTPTGSGKSLVATAMHLRGLALGDRSVYTSPIKALVSEKFFALCRDFGAQNVGMMTGDASVNRDAPILCCTAEVLASMALREGDRLDVQHVVMDEFHYYADRDRGMAWQVPLLTLPQTTFLLMSATLGETEALERDLRAFTGKDVALVASAKRPVPLDFLYRTATIQEAVSDLLGSGRAPVYIVNFSQREAAEEAQSLTSIAVQDREGRAAIAAAIGGFRFDSPYGKDVQRFVRHGIGVHHAGLLPKYRLLVEKLAQKGLLKVISGTDTLGVGVNVPIRTVLFTKLCKYDGEKTRILTVRDFLQIAGRAGRKGFDDRGWVVCLAPEHVVENQKLEAKSDGKKFKKKSAPDKHYVPWEERTFDALIGGTPEPLTSVFKIDHGTMVSLLQSAETQAEPTRGGGYAALVQLIARSHERPARKSWLRKEARRIFKTLMRAGVVELVPRGPTGPEGQARSGRPGRDLRVSRDLQDDFSLHHTLSLFLVFALHRQDPSTELYALNALTLVESILESPKSILERQADKAKRLMIEQLKAEGVPFEERIERIQDIRWPEPNAEAVWALFDVFLESHPWAEGEPVRVKGIAREMAEQYMSFNDFVREYGLERIEGVLLRYLSDVYKTFSKNVPDDLKTDAVWDLLAYLRTLVARADSSLLQEWEQLRSGVQLEVEGPERPARPVDIASDPKALMAQLRAELHALVKALSKEDWEDAATLVDPNGAIATPDAFREAMSAFQAEHGRLRFDHQARLPDKTQVSKLAERHWEVTQVLLGRKVEADEHGEPEIDEHWALVAEIDLTGGPVTPDTRLLAITRIG